MCLADIAVEGRVPCAVCRELHACFKFGLAPGPVLNWRPRVGNGQRWRRVLFTCSTEDWHNSKTSTAVIRWSFPLTAAPLDRFPIAQGGPDLGWAKRHGKLSIDVRSRTKNQDSAGLI